MGTAGVPRGAASIIILFVNLILSEEKVPLFLPAGVERRPGSAIWKISRIINYNDYNITF